MVKTSLCRVLVILVSFIEAIFFPVPPDVMLIPMSMSKPKSAFRFALYTTIASVVGGMIGYAIGTMPLIGYKGLYSTMGLPSRLGSRPLRGLKEWGYF